MKRFYTLARMVILGFFASNLLNATPIDQTNRTDVAKAMYAVAKELNSAPQQSLPDPYTGQKNAFNPGVSRSMKVDGLDFFEMHTLHLTSYHLPPSAMVPKVWLSLKTQEFFKAPTHVPVIMVTPTKYDTSGSTHYPLAVLSHGSGGSLHLQLWYAQILAQRGYVVAVIDHFAAKGRQCNPMDIKTFHIESNAMDIVRVVDYMKKQPYIDEKNVFVIGWSLGGMAVEMSARASFVNAVAPHVSYNAAICFYPQIVVQEMLPIHKSKLFFILAGADDYTPAHNIYNYVARMKKLPGQKHHHVRVVEAKGAHHSFDRINFTPFWSYWSQVLYNWSAYQGLGRGLINPLGRFIADKVFGDYAYYKLQTFKHGQILIDTQNPLRGFAPLDAVHKNDMEAEISHDFKPWDEFMTYFQAHVSHGASLQPDPQAQKWALDQLLGYLDKHMVASEGEQCPH